MTVAEFLRDVVLGFSAFGAGLGLYLGVLNTADWLRGARWAWAYAGAKLAYVIVVLLVAELVYKSPFIPVAWRSWLYLFGLALGGVCFIGMTMERRDHGTRRWTDKRTK